MSILWPFFPVLALAGWTYSGARRKEDRALVGAVVALLLFSTWLLNGLLPDPYRFPTRLVLLVLEAGVLVHLGHRFRRQAMEAVLAGTVDGAENNRPTG